MKELKAGILSVVAASLLLSAGPAYALGGCGANAHRDANGRCVFGGQNQNYCLKKTGHPATRMPDGTLRCLR